MGFMSVNSEAERTQSSGLETRQISGCTSFVSDREQTLLIIMYIYHALINALRAHMIHINLNMIFYTHVDHSPTKTIYIKYYKNIQ